MSPVLSPTVFPGGIGVQPKQVGWEANGFKLTMRPGMSRGARGRSGDRQWSERRLIEELASLCTAATIELWLRGGWVIHFFLGRITREHEDIDLFICGKDAQGLMERLQHAGVKELGGPVPDDQRYVARNSDLIARDDGALITHGEARIQVDAGNSVEVVARSTVLGDKRPAVRRCRDGPLVADRVAGPGARTGDCVPHFWRPAAYPVPIRSTIGGEQYSVPRKVKGTCGPASVTPHCRGAHS